MVSCKKHYGQDATIIDMFSPEVPLVTRNEQLTFGEFMSEISEISSRYRCSIFSPSERSCSISINGQEAYSLIMYMFKESEFYIKDSKDQVKLTPVIIDLIEMLSKWVDINQSQTCLEQNYVSEFIDAARSCFRITYDQLERFDDKKANIVASRCHVRAKSIFGKELGFFQGVSMASSAWREGSTHGEQQAEQLLKKDGLTKEDVKEDIVITRY